MNVLVIDIGGTNVKIWKTGEADKLKFPSGKSLDPSVLVKQIKKLTSDWSFRTQSRSAIRGTWSTAGRWPIRIIWRPAG